MVQYGSCQCEFGQDEPEQVQNCWQCKLAVDKQGSPDLLSITSYNLTGTLNIIELENPEHHLNVSPLTCWWA